MKFNLAVSAVLVASAFAGLPGCAVDSSPDAADTEEAAASQDELTSNAQRLVGSFQGGSSAHPPTFQSLAFAKDGTFSADLDTGIRCITAPCPSAEHLQGRYTATKTSLHLYVKAGAPASAFYGRYHYTLIGTKLSLTSTTLGAAWSNELDRAPAAAPIWPATATKLVAENSGGGFRPPAPAGSTCAIGHEKYTLLRGTRHLAWETCESPDNVTPAHTQTGSKTITVAQLATVEAAMNGVTLSTEDMCGADKPLYQIQVTTPAGAKTYTDSFYKCQGGSRTYVDGIDDVFSELRTAAE
jgi:hypothetical protein